jgi:peptidoglycan/xylan/chitin deacetylase (PgdA/CDA1 family)
LTLASLYFGALRSSGLTALARRVSSRPLVLCYHNVVADRDANSSDDLGLHMPLATFVRQMRWLARNYQVVSLAELVARISNRTSLRGLAAVTFDDGYRGVFEHAWPVLRDLGIPTTVFIVAAAPGRDACFWWDDPGVRRAYSPSQLDSWLTVQRGDGAAIMATLPRGAAAPNAVSSCRKAASWQTVAAAANEGLQVGAHSMTHRSLTALDERELQHEVSASREIIKQRTGVIPEFFAYPYGHWNDRVRTAICAAGYRGAFTLAHGDRAIDPWSLPRLNIPASIPDAAFHAWTAGLRPPRRRGP